MRLFVVREQSNYIERWNLRNNNVILLAPLAFVASILRSHRTSPEDTEGVGRTTRVGAVRAWNLAWTTLKVGVEALTADSARTLVSTFLNIVAGHDGISVDGQSVSGNMSGSEKTHPMYPLA